MLNKHLIEESTEKLKSMGFDVEKIQGKVEQLIEEFEEFVDYKVKYEVYDEFNISKDRISVGNGVFLHGEYVVENLKGSDYIVAAVISLGEEIESKIKEFFQKGEYTKGFILDTISNVFLEEVTLDFWKDLKKKSESYGKRITPIFFPGNNWDIKNQLAIFRLARAEEIGLKINENFMILPEKSVSFVCGIGENVKTCEIAASCDNCPLVDCIYRKKIMSKQLGEKRYKVIVYFEGKEKELVAREGENLFYLLSRNGIYLPNSCGGNRICGKCRVRVDKSYEVSEQEAYFLSREEIEKNVRLACFVEVRGDLKVQVLYKEGKARILTENKKDIEVPLDSRIDKRPVVIALPTLEDQRDFVERVKEAVGEFLEIPLSVVRNIPSFLEKENSKVTLVLRKSELIAIERVDLANKKYGIALDIGTTTIVAYLYDLDSGKQIDVYSSLNPQRNFGADVISRIEYALKEREGLNILHFLLIEEINKAISEFSWRNKIERDNIYEIVAVGNPTMIHFLLKVDVKNIAVSPYVPTFTSMMEIKAKDLGIKINEEGYVITLPLISAYVGADTIAAVLGSKMDLEEDMSLLIDIGTNGEMILGNKHKMIASSAAAGPAFEGGGITFGMPALEGAIDHVDFAKVPPYTTVGGKEPKGICGSGIVDAISELLRYGIIDKTGRIVKDVELFKERVGVFKGEDAFLIGGDIYITQRDIRQVQMAKGAIRAGIDIMLKEMGIDVKDVKKVFLAGGFGNYISPKSAVEIGLIPKELEGKVLQIGNSAGMGAVMCLLSEKELKRAVGLKDKIRYIELSTHPDFQKKFMDGMYF
ncbi:MAG: DUF4445 domain-containing protein [Caldanaerobacter subterraneus]|nr:DUF4445 domain-containing protein [Caldanaerobacter subterraneus]